MESPNRDFVDTVARLVDSHLARRIQPRIFAAMAEFEYLQYQARKCRTLASGLSNSDDVRKLEELARELESKARIAKMAAIPSETAAIL